MYYKASYKFLSLFSSFVLRVQVENMMWVEDGLDDLEDLDDVAMKTGEWSPHFLNRFLSYDTMNNAAPASQIFSVQIVCDSFKHGGTCLVYGEINIMDGDATSSKIYSRKRNRAQALTSEHNTLALSIPEECAASSSWIEMSLCLKDSADESLIIDEVFRFEKVTTEGDYDRVRVGQVRGIAGSAIVQYTVFATADLAVVQIALRRNVSSDIDSDALPADANLYGRIVARYGHTYGKTFPGILLFEKPSTQSIRAVPNSTINLCSSAVAAPAYCFLSIDVKFYDSFTNEPLICRKAECLAVDKLWSDDIDIETKDFILRVRVTWYHPYMCCDQVDDPFQFDNPEFMPWTKRIGRGLSLGERRYLGLPLIEVFSVMIDTDFSSGVNIYGTVTVWDSPKTYQLYDTRLENPETLSTNEKSISLRGPSNCFDAEDGFAMKVVLSDVRGRVSIEGDVLWSIRSLKSQISWYDRRICSIIRGVHGYAAVFYSIFSGAVQALVQVSLKPKGSLDGRHNFYGSIVARYSIEDYSTDYEQKYYQSVLFKERKENPLELTSEFIVPLLIVPLLKSVVVVPADSSLKIKVDLCTETSGDESSEECLEGVAEFEISNDCIPTVIKGKRYEIECSVKWSKTYGLYTR